MVIFSFVIAQKTKISSPGLGDEGIKPGKIPSSPNPGTVLYAQPQVLWPRETGYSAKKFFFQSWRDNPWAFFAWVMFKKSRQANNDLPLHNRYKSGRRPCRLSVSNPL